MTTKEEYMDLCKSLIRYLDDVHCYTGEIFGEATGKEKELIIELGYGYIYIEEEE